MSTAHCGVNVNALEADYAPCGGDLPCALHPQVARVKPPANLMLQEIEAGRALAVALQRYLAVADLGNASAATDDDHRELKLRALDVYNALNRCEVVMPIPPSEGEN